MPVKLTTEDFIERARLKHGDRYDYSKSVYLGCSEQVEIICKEHGPFWQVAENHMNNGLDCPSCSLAKRFNTSTFIEKAIKKHGDRYDYSKTVYVDSKTKIEIVCKEHGSFWQWPVKHTSAGSNCPKCSKFKHNTQEFIESAVEVHGNRYDYSKVVYDGSSIPIEIICKEHGPFWQKPGDHVRLGCNCPACAGVKRHTNKSFIEKARSVHGDKYDYSLSNYVKAHTNVIIICKKHGEFNQSPTSHFSGAVCPACDLEDRSTKYICTTEKFIEKALKVHKGYDYSLVDYKGSHKKINLICPNGHSIFQTPTKHLSGDGCMECSRLVATGFINETILLRDEELANSEYTLYYVLLKSKTSDESFYKIGLTTGLEHRLRSFKGYTAEVIRTCEGRLTDLFRMEQMVLEEMRFLGRSYIPENKFGGYTECFTLRGDEDEL